MALAFYLGFSAQYYLQNPRNTAANTYFKFFFSHIGVSWMFASILNGQPLSTYFLYTSSISVRVPGSL